MPVYTINNYDLKIPHQVDSGIATIVGGNAIGLHDKISIAVGDMHGNAGKLLSCLFTLGLAVADASIQNNLWGAYCKAYRSNPSQEDREKALVDFESNLTQLWRGPLCTKIKLILIGDTLCDRGNSDYMIMLLYEWMATHCIDFVIIFSNHDMLFIHVLAHEFNQDFLKILPKLQGMDVSRLKQFYGSLLDCPGLYGTCATKYRQRVKDIYTCFYLPRLKAIDCDLVTFEVGLPPKMIYYTHAPRNEQILLYVIGMIRPLIQPGGREDTVLANLIFQVSPVITTVDHLHGIINFLNVVLYTKLQTLTGDELIKFFDKAFLAAFVEEKNSYFPQLDTMINVFGHIGPTPVVNNRQVNLDSHLGLPGDSYIRGDLLLHWTRHISLPVTCELSSAPRARPKTC